MRASRSIRLVAIACLACTLVIATGGRAQANFHLLRITEVFPAASDQPAAQFIELQMYGANQTFVVGQRVAVFDASGTEVAAFTFTSPLANGDNQAYALVATPEAEARFGVEADLEMTPIVPAGGGKACFGSTSPPIDCVSWGNYSGDSTGTGTPFNSPVGLLPDQSMERKLSGGNDPNRLDAEDDTDDSAADFQFAAPSPTNNEGAEVTVHERSVTLTLKGALVAKGRVSVDDDFAQCVQEVPVKVQRRSQGGWKTVKSTETNGEGSYRVSLADRPGTYRAVAPETVPASGQSCSKAVSRKRTHD